ncbi:MAG: hypothetical protein NTY19_22875 [Planctomycetota bacterium]|nr:hypothetical protein [Planctomycetota bacterium]
MRGRLRGDRFTATLCLTLCGSALLGQAGGEEVVIPARNCSARSPNVKPADPAWDDLMVCPTNC